MLTSVNVSKTLSEGRLEMRSDEPWAGCEPNTSCRAAH